MILWWEPACSWLSLRDPNTKNSRSGMDVYKKSTWRFNLPRKLSLNEAKFRLHSHSKTFWNQREQENKNDGDHFWTTNWDWLNDATTDLESNNRSWLAGSFTKAVMKHYEMHIVISLWYAKMAIVLTFKPFYWYVQRPNAFVKRITVHCASNKLGLCLGTILYLLLSYEVF